MGKPPKQNGQGEINFTSGQPITVETTQPDKILMHKISEAQLLILSENSLTFIQEAMWAAIGVFVGSLSGSIIAIVKLWQETEALQIPDLINCCACFAALVTIILCFFIRKNSQTSRQEVINEIRDRTNREIGRIQDN